MVSGHNEAENPCDNSEWFPIKVMIAKCACQHCGNPIEFEMQHNGEAARCPHCGRETVLASPKNTVTVDVKPPEPPKTVPVAEFTKIEDLLDEVAGLFFGGGIIGGLIGICGALICGADDHMEFVLPLIAFSAASVFQGFVFRTIFRAFSEIIRLLRALVIAAQR